MEWGDRVTERKKKIKEIYSFHLYIFHKICSLLGSTNSSLSDKPHLSLVFTSKVLLKHRHARVLTGP